MIPSATGQSDFGLAVKIMGAQKPSVSSQKTMLSCVSAPQNVIQDAMAFGGQLTGAAENRSPFRNLMGQTMNQQSNTVAHD